MNYVYIGAEKTSTTYLQRLFNSNKAVFAKQANVHYLSAPGMMPSMLRAARADAPFSPPARLKIAPERNLIVSEFFYRDLNTPARIAGLRPILDALMPGPYRVVLYVRGQTDWLVSFYSTYIKRGGTLPFAAYMDFILHKKKSFYYNRFSGHWQDAFGDMLEVYQYSGGTVLDAVLERFDVDGKTITYKDPGQANVSLPVESMEILRKVNKALSVMPKGAQREALQATFRKQLMEAPYGEAKLRATEAQRARIEAMFAEDNQTLNARWGTALPG